MPARTGAEGEEGEREGEEKRGKRKKKKKKKKKAEDESWPRCQQLRRSQKRESFFGGNQGQGAFPPPVFLEFLEW